MTAGCDVFILAKVKPFVVPKDVAVKSKFDCVVKVFVPSSGVVFEDTSLKDCVATTLTLNSVAPPLVNPPNPNSSESAEDLISVEPPLLESKSTEYVFPLS